MEPLKLTIENFCGHEKSVIDFDKFSIALIVGKQKGNDKISNGVGKSTIFSAIKYVLFNETDFSSLDRIIRRGCDYCRVSLEFRVKEEVYKVIRRRSKREVDLRLFVLANDNWTDITQRRPSDTEKELFKLIKMNAKTFSNSVLFSQAEVINGLAALTPGMRKVILKDALQLGVYSVFEKLAKKKTADILKDIDKEKIILSTFGDPKSEIMELDDQLKGLQDIVSEKNCLLEFLND